MGFALRLFVVMLLSLGLLLPRVSVMLAQLGGAERVVFCDGTAMVVLSLDEDGAPHQISHEDLCGLVFAKLPDAVPQILPPAVPRPVRLGRRFAARPHLRAVRAHGPRAPPLSAAPRD